MDLRGTEHRADTALGGLAFREAAVSHLLCSPRTGKWVGLLLSQDGQARVPDKRGVCQPLLPFHPTAESLFLTNDEMKVLCGC